MAFTAQDVAKLREQTGAGMMDCKKALVHTDGDMKKAAEYLREQGIAGAAKKADRVASEGVVATFISKGGKSGALVEVNCESDFVAKNADFMTLCDNIAEHVDAACKDGTSVDDMLLQKYSKNSKVTVGEYINEGIAKIGEKISIRRIAKYDATAKVAVGSYIHMGGKIGVMVEIAGTKDLSKNEQVLALCKDVSMHIAAYAPMYVASSDVPASDVDNEKRIIKAQTEKEGKPANVVDKMVEGRLKKYYKEVCLLEQEYAKDSSVNVQTYVQNVGKQVGDTLEIKRFVRFVMGEGLEKKVDNLAEEVAKITQK